MLFLAKVLVESADLPTISEIRVQTLPLKHRIANRARAGRRIGETAATKTIVTVMPAIRDEKEPT